MQVYLPIAEMAVSVEVILLLGTLVGFLSGVFGIGGGFLATPFLIFLGLPPAIAVGSQACQLVASSLTGVLGHWWRGNVDTKMAGIMLAGSMPGTLAGIGIFRLLQNGGYIDLVIPVLYVLLLGGLGTMMFFESLSALLKRGRGEGKRLPVSDHPWFRHLPYKMSFPRSRLYISVLVPAAIGVASGLLVSLMGVGSGFLLVPAMIYIFRMPTVLVAGTSLLHILITTAVAAMLHATANHSVDIVLALFMILGGVVGAHAGVRLSRRLNPAHARIALALILLLISAQLGAQLLIPPHDLYVTERP